MIEMPWWMMLAYGIFCSWTSIWITQWRARRERRIPRCLKCGRAMKLADPSIARFLPEGSRYYCLGSYPYNHDPIWHTGLVIEVELHEATTPEST